MTVTTGKLIDLSRESVNISMKKVIMLMTALVYLMVAVGPMIFFVFGIGSGLGSNSLSLAFFIKCMALSAAFLAVPVKPLVGEVIYK